MLTVVRDTHYIAFTLAPDPSIVRPAVSCFKDLAPGWGIHNSETVAVALRQMLLNALSTVCRSGQSGTLRCRIERSSEGPFKITVEQGGEVSDSNRRDCLVPKVLRKAHGRAHVGICRMFGKGKFNPPGMRMAVFVDADVNGKETL